MCGESCYSPASLPVAEGHKPRGARRGCYGFKHDKTLLPDAELRRVPRPEIGMALLLLSKKSKGMGVADKVTMTRTGWLLLGAVMLGVAVFLYFVVFCPVECH